MLPETSGVRSRFCGAEHRFDDLDTGEGIRGKVRGVRDSPAMLDATKEPTMPTLRNVTLSIGSQTQDTVVLTVGFVLEQNATEQQTLVEWEGEATFLSFEEGRFLPYDEIRLIPAAVVVGPSSEEEITGSFDVKFDRVELDEDPWWLNWFDSEDEILVDLYFKPRVPNLGHAHGRSEILRAYF